MTQDKLEMLVKMIGAFVLAPMQEESVKVNVQKMVNRLNKENQEMLYKLIKDDLSARMQQQISAMKDELERM